jgi:hypothetical protein
MKRASPTPTAGEKTRKLTKTTTTTTAGEKTRKVGRNLPFAKQDKSQLAQAKDLTFEEVKLVVGNYYAEQEARKRADMQIRHLGDKFNPLLIATANAHAEWERFQEKIMEEFARQHPVGRWMLELTGVGPVLSAGFLAQLACGEIPETVGHWNSFAGLNPDQKWLPKTKRPYNAGLKQLCYHFGVCTKFTCNHPDTYYGLLYKAQKAKYEARNEAGGFAAKAAVFEMKEPKRQAEVRASGKVPPFYLDSLATRWTTKIFLSHLHALLYWHTKGKAPPKPFAISILGHAHEVKVPNTVEFPGFEDAYYGKPHPGKRTILGRQPVPPKRELEVA